MLQQAVFYLRERHALIFQLDDAVFAPQEQKSARLRFNQIRRLHARCPRRLRPQCAVCVLPKRYAVKRLPHFAAAPRSNDACFGAAVDFVGAAGVGGELGGGGFGQCAAR